MNWMDIKPSESTEGFVGQWDYLLVLTLLGLSSYYLFFRWYDDLYALQSCLKDVHEHIVEMNHKRISNEPN